MFTQILIYTFFFAAGVLALLALLRAFSARDVPDVTRFPPCSPTWRWH